MMNEPDTRCYHAWTSSNKQNAKKAHNSIQGHYHSLFEIVYFADGNLIRWAMNPGCLINSKAPAFRYAKGMKPIIGCGVIFSKNGNFLVIPDMHIPYHHQDSVDFLIAVYNKYECVHVLNTGDITDNHAGSFHESETDALSPEDEYKETCSFLQELEEVFPQMDITTGNHDAIPVRKLKSAGLPASMLSDFNHLYGLKGSWLWHDDELKIDTAGGVPLLVPMVLNKHGRWNKTVSGCS